MRRIIVQEFLTLDGVMQAPGDPDEDRTDGFEHGGWQLPYFDETTGEVLMSGFADTGGFLFGRRTYDVFARHWPNQPPDDPLAPVFNDAQKWVVSTSLSEPLSWGNTTLIRADVPGEIRKLKAADGGDIRVIGSGELVQMLIKEGLVDEFQLIIHPLVLGKGKRLFRDGLEPSKLRLTSSRPNSKGVLILTYELADEAASGEKVAVPVEEGQPA